MGRSLIHQQQDPLIEKALREMASPCLENTARSDAAKPMDLAGLPMTRYAKEIGPISSATDQTDNHGTVDMLENMNSRRALNPNSELASGSRCH